MMEVLEPRGRDKATTEAVRAVNRFDVDIRTPKGTVRVVGNVSFPPSRAKRWHSWANPVAENS